MKLFWGALFCQGVIGSVLVLGWCSRVTQRSAYRYWWRLGSSPPISFAELLRSDDRFAPHLTWPNWFLSRQSSGSLNHGKSFSFYPKALLGSLVSNARLGLQVILNTWVLTLPAGILWLFAWYDGWMNSAAKGYEHAAVGPFTGILGFVLFITALFYLPLAQARQAVTEDWKAFYEFRFIRRLIRKNLLGCLGLAACYFLLSVPMTVAFTVPAFLTQKNATLADATPEQAVQWLNGYYFYWGFYFFSSLVFLKWLGGKVYASALWRAVQTGAVSEEELSENEWLLFHRLDLFRYPASAQSKWWVRLAATNAQRMLRASCGVIAGLLWFGVAALLFVQAFFNYRGAFLWLNQPLIQLPWIRQIPSHLQNPAGGLLLAVLVFSLGALLYQLARGGRKSFRKS